MQEENLKNQEQEIQEENLKTPVEKKTNLAVLQNKIGELEKSLQDLKIRSKENLDRLKVKLKKEQERLHILIEDVKKLKPVEYSLSLFKSFLNWVKRSPKDPVRSIFCIQTTNCDQYIRGYAVYSKHGMVYLAEAESLDFSSGHPVVMEKVGNMAINQDAIIMWYEG